MIWIELKKEQLRMLGKCLGAAALIAALFVGAKAEDADFMPKVDMNAWKYQEEADVWYQTGISYCKLPADPDIETMGFFVPGAYMMGTDNGDGTWSCEISADGALSGYTADTAPVIIPVNTPGYSAMAAPDGFDGSYAEFLSAGFVVAAAGCRGREDGAPAGVTDLKAAIRYARYNAGHIPGNMERIFSEGMSGGGAQSALLGATGDAPEYMPYLLAIGAVQSVSDAILGSMDWCPITNLDSADAAYEWNMAVSRTGLDETTLMISDRLSETFAAYINNIGLKDENGNPLTLEASGILYIQMDSVGPHTDRMSLSRYDTMSLISTFLFFIFYNALNYCQIMLTIPFERCTLQQFTVIWMCYTC